MHTLMQKSGLVWEIDNVCLFLTYEVQSANSSPFISLCIVYSNIGHRAHKSSPCSAKTAPFVCTVLTDSILCPLTSPPQLSPLPQPPLICPALSPWNTLTGPCVRRALETNYVLFLFIFFFFLQHTHCRFYGKKGTQKRKKKIDKNRDAFLRFPSACAHLQMFPPPVSSARSLFASLVWEGK